MSQSLFQQISQHISEQVREHINPHVPEQFNQLGTELDRSIHAATEKALARFNIVSREEFDTQQAILLKTREKLELLEQTVAKMNDSGAVHDAE